MLCLSRKVGETIIIEGPAEMIVTRIQGNRVTIGIKASKDIKIRRGELNRTVTVWSGIIEIRNDFTANSL